MKINIKILNDLAKIPTRGHDGDAGMDLYAATDCTIQIAPHSTVMIGTGFAMEIPDGYFGGIFARSGLASKKGLRPATCVSVIDTPYRGEIKVALHNDTDELMEIAPHERIAQLIVMPYLAVEFEEVAELSETQRGSGGFGSTGK